MKEMYILAGIGALLLCIGAAIFNLTSMKALATVTMSLGIFVILVAPVAID